MQLTRLNRNRTTFGYLFIYLLTRNLSLLSFQNWQNVVSAISGYKISYIFFKSIKLCYKHKTLPMYYLHPLNILKICFQSESHKNKTNSKQLRKFFVSPVKFTKVHVQGFVNEPTVWNEYQNLMSWLKLPYTTLCR